MVKKRRNIKSYKKIVYKRLVVFFCDVKVQRFAILSKNNVDEVFLFGVGVMGYD